MARSKKTPGRLKAYIKSLTRPLILASSLVLLSLSVLFMADLVGISTSKNGVSKESRKAIVEALAIQLSTLASNGQFNEVQAATSRFVLRNDDVRGAALLRGADVVLAEIGEINVFDSDSSDSTATQMRVPIYKENRSWGEVQVVFSDGANRWKEFLAYGLIALFSLISFTAFLNRALVQLDPKQAVPGRVDSAMDLFSAGVIVLDEKLRIVMANTSAETIVNRKANELLGRELDEWPWQKDSEWEAPWATTLNVGLSVSDRQMTLKSDDGEERSLLISCVFVGGSDGGRKGVLVTMDDITIVESQNRELTVMVSKLRQSQELIEEKNRELKELATIDPLSGIANRRALMEALDNHISDAYRDETKLACIMTDIDHFKQVNDVYGHKVGDDVIKASASVLQSLCRDEDIVGRYGGEEFVMVLPGMDAEAAAEVAEKARIATIALAYGEDLPLDKLSASYGVSDLSCEPTDGASFVDSADQGLYQAKESGRNRVVIFNSDMKNSSENEKAVVEKQASESVNQSDSDRLQARTIELEKQVQQRDEKLNKLGEFDSLTGMPLRSIFLKKTEAELARALRNKNLVGVISFEFTDIDRLLATFGYAQSEELLKEVLDHLQTGIRSTELVSMLSAEHSLSRITSNEYAVLLSSLTDTTSAMIVVTRMKSLLSEPFMLAGEKVWIGASIGISISSADDRNADVLLSEANEARKTAAFKNDKISHVFAKKQLHADSDDYIRLESDLHDAIDNAAIETWFQPKFDIAKNRIVGMEALLRWNHETRGFVSPELFVAMAESNGLIDKLSQRVLEATLKQILVWRSMGFEDLRVSINISPSQFRAATLVDYTLKQMQDAGVEGRQLEIELTETSVLENPEQTRMDLVRLQEAGVGVSLDDFGTGYTSLSLLSDLPLDVVKIDRSFVTPIESSERSRAVVGSVISMAHALNLRVVAEGVETNAQLELLQQLGCDEVQGYLICRPQPADEITAFLVNQQVNERKKSA